MVSVLCDILHCRVTCCGCVALCVIASGGSGLSKASLRMQRCLQLHSWSQADAPPLLQLCVSQSSCLSRAREVACGANGTAASALTRTLGADEKQPSVLAAGAAEAVPRAQRPAAAVGAAVGGGTAVATRVHWGDGRDGRRDIGARDL